MKITQCERIIEYLMEFGAITQLEAIRDLGCFRLASRISDLKKQGHNIVSEMVAVKNRWGEKTYVASYSFADDNVKFDRKECEGV